MSTDDPVAPAGDPSATAGEPTPRAAPRPRLMHADRDRPVPVPISIDALIGPEHTARTVWAFVQQLDLEPLRAKVKSVEDRPGRPAIDPAILVALWLYATIDAVGSARKLDRLCDTDAVYRWLCGGVSVNYHTLADFRTGHGDWLDAALTRSIASLVDHQLVSLKRIAQDGMRVRASAKAASFRRRPTLEQLLVDARARVAALKQELSGDGLTQRQKAAHRRAADEREQRLVEALATMQRIETERTPKRKPGASDDPDDHDDPPASPGPQAEAVPAPGTGKARSKTRSEPRVSSTDPEARVMKMADGGFRPAFNIQLAVDIDTQLVVGVDIVNLGSDMSQMLPMHERFTQRYGIVPEHWLADGGYTNLAAITGLAATGTEVIAPVPASRKPGIDPHEPKAHDTDAVAAWRTRMASEAGCTLYKWRAATVECMHAHERRRGLIQFPVRGLAKARCAALWHALAHDVIGLVRLGVLKIV